MANLNSWQRIDRVIAGKPFGDGVDGDYNSSTIPTMTYRSCSGSASSTTLTLTSAGFSNGDLILIHQTRGTGAGQWEINKVVGGGGTTSLTLDKALQYTYTDSGASQAQAVKILRYNNVTCPSGTWTVPSWNGDTGGILVLAARWTVTINGVIDGSGANGGVANDPGGGTGGFAGGQGLDATPTFDSYCGEGTAGGSFQTNSANGNGGGGGRMTGAPGSAGGGGGGNGAAGGNGSANNGVGGTGGSTAGSADLTNMVFGGAGGGGARESVNNTGSGGAGGKIIFLIGKTISVGNSFMANGGVGGNEPSTSADGGSGAGGSILLVCSSSTLGSSLLTATGGAAGGAGGAGGAGRIALHYFSSYSGSTNPTLYANQDPTLVESSSGVFFHNFL